MICLCSSQTNRLANSEPDFGLIESDCSNFEFRATEDTQNLEIHELVFADSLNIV